MHSPRVMSDYYSTVKIVASDAIKHCTIVIIGHLISVSNGYCYLKPFSMWQALKHIHWGCVLLQTSLQLRHKDKKSWQSDFITSNVCQKIYIPILASCFFNSPKRPLFLSDDRTALGVHKTNYLIFWSRNQCPNRTSVLFQAPFILVKMKRPTYSSWI